MTDKKPEDIALKIARLRYILQAEERTYTNKLNNINKELRTLQGLCDHESVEYYPDPSGNNDSSYMCTACGKAGRRKHHLGGRWTKPTE